jgi:hypothetical protein
MIEELESVVSKAHWMHVRSMSLFMYGPKCLRVGLSCSSYSVGHFNLYVWRALYIGLVAGCAAISLGGSALSFWGALGERKRFLCLSFLPSKIFDSCEWLVIGYGKVIHSENFHLILC